MRTEVPCIGSVTDLFGNTRYYLYNGVEMLHTKRGAVQLSKDGHRYKFYSWASKRGLVDIAKAHGGRAS